MKNKINFLFLFLQFTTIVSCFAQQPFITTWKTDNPGTSNNTSITIPTHSSETYNYDVDWNNDGIFDEFGITGDVTHDFGVIGEYTIAIQGDFPRIYFNSGGDKKKIKFIRQWGDIVWSSMERAFYGCRQLNIHASASDSPNLSMVSSMNSMFRDAYFFNQNIANWDVSNVTDMSWMFANTIFNQDLSSWDVSNVTNMSGMFDNTPFFNQNVSNWDVSNVTDMSWMFSNTNSFNQNISNWNVSNVTDMSRMFYDAYSFNQDISSWNVSNVTNMSWMFQSAPSFNQNLGNWNVASATLNYMLSSSGLSTINYDSTLIGWESQGITDKNLGATGLRYCASDSVRNELIYNHGWTITGDIIDDISCKTVATTSLKSVDIFEIYPNPTSGQFFINAKFEKPLNDVQIEIFNKNGQIIKKIKIGNNINAIQEKIDLSNLVKGNYYILIRSDVEQIGKMILLH